MENLGHKLDNYNSNRELYGSGNNDLGHNLADAMIKARETLKLNHRIERESKIIEILEESYPHIVNVPKRNIKLKGVLGKLNRLGVDVGNYRNMAEPEKFNKYISLMKKFDLL